jgi:hypothetical protein
MTLQAHTSLTVVLGSGPVYSGPWFAMGSPYSLFNWELIPRRFTFKMFPDVIGFYAGLSLTVLGAWLLQRSPRYRAIIHRRVWVRRAFHPSFIALLLHSANRACECMFVRLHICVCVYKCVCAFISVYVRL